MSVLAFLLIFMDADKAFTINKNYSDKLVPAWNYYILQFMIIVVYFYGGLAKLTYDWLVLKMPITQMIESASRSSELIQLLNNDFGIGLFTYGGQIFDLAIGLLLLFRKTRYIAIPALLIFNIMNATLLFNDIYIFPYFMIFSTILFFDPNAVKSFFQKINLLKLPSVRTKTKKQTVQHFKYNKKVVIGLIVFTALQILIPFRQYMFEGYADWTMEAQRFSWRMKTQNRDIKLIRFHITNTDFEVNNTLSFSIWKDGDRFTEENLLPKGKLIALTDDQITLMGFNPDAAWQFAQYIDKWMETDKNFNAPNVEVRAEIIVDFNGREPQYLIKPEVDLLKAENSPYKHKTWIMPLIN